jgi:hypothetical protein
MVMKANRGGIKEGCGENRRGESQIRVIEKHLFRRLELVRGYLYVADGGPA